MTRPSSSSAAAVAPMRAKAPKMPPISEKQFMAQVIALAELFGWKHWHDAATNAPRRCTTCGSTRRGPRNESGWPDLVLVRRPRVIFAELKRQDGKVTEDQQAWLDELTACGQDARVWKPSDWDEVVEALA